MWSRVRHLVREEESSSFLVRRGWKDAPKAFFQEMNTMHFVKASNFAFSTVGRGVRDSNEVRSTRNTALQKNKTKQSLMGLPQFVSSILLLP